MREDATFGPVHLESHSRLLVTQLALGGPSARPDGIIIPSARRARYLAPAAALAADLRIPLLALCSHEAEPLEVAEVLAEAGARGAAVVVASERPPAALASLRTVRRSWGRMPRHDDVSAKRNFAQLIGRALRWRSVLFLDDDVRGLHPPGADLRGVLCSHCGGMRELCTEGVKCAARALRSSRLRAMAWRIVDFPDNSAVCHAHRLAGGGQDVSAGIGALLVDLDGDLALFPPTYNEDWFFLHDWMRRGLVGNAGLAWQEGYEPFDEVRADREEFGDVLAESIYRLIHDQRPVTVAMFASYWGPMLQLRRAFIDDIEQRLERHSGAVDSATVGRALHALDLARHRLGQLSPSALAEYVAAWRHDQYVWNARLRQVPAVASLPQALELLGLAAAECVGEPVACPA